MTAEDEAATDESDANRAGVADAAGPETASTDGGTRDGSVAVPATDDASLTELAQRPAVKAWVTFVATLGALVGAGMGIVMLLADAVDEHMFEYDAIGEFGVEIEMGATGLPPEQAIFWTVPIAAVLGVYLGLTLATDDRTTFVAAGISAFAGTAVLLVVSAFFTSIAVDGISLDIGGLLITAIAAGIAVGAVSVGAGWIARNRTPRDGAIGPDR